MYSSNKPAGMSPLLGDTEVPCAVCHRKQRSSVLMIPGKFLIKHTLFIFICTWSPRVTPLLIMTNDVLVYYIKRLLHDIFHIGPDISPRLPYQARQRSWRADMGRGLISGTIWKISCP